MGAEMGPGGLGASVAPLRSRSGQSPAQRLGPGQSLPLCGHQGPTHEVVECHPPRVRALNSGGQSWRGQGLASQGGGLGGLTPSWGAWFLLHVHC